MSVDSSVRTAIEDVIYRGVVHLDEREFGSFLELTSSDFHYAIKAYSPDLRKDMVFLDHDRAGIVALVELLPKHHVNGASWLRHVVVQTVSARRGSTVESVSSLALFQTVVDAGDAHVDGGSSQLFAVGRYHDKLRLEGDLWVLSERVVRLQTRQLGIGSHIIP